MGAKSQGPSPQSGTEALTPLAMGVLITWGDK